MRKAHLRTPNRHLYAPSQASDAAYNSLPAGGQNSIHFSPAEIPRMKQVSLSRRAALLEAVSQREHQDPLPAKDTSSLDIRLNPAIIAGNRRALSTAVNEESRSAEVAREAL
jgi:hypothetical protein